MRHPFIRLIAVMAVMFGCDDGGSVVSAVDGSASDGEAADVFQGADATDDAAGGDAANDDAGTPPDAATGDAEVEPDAEIEPPHWGYEGEVGPDQWGELSPEWAACADGTEQSPIDVPPVSPSNHPEMEFEYREGDQTYDISNNGHTVQATLRPGNTLSVADHDWELLQFHFHAGSEHTVNGHRSPLEMHLVHRDEAGALAVVGVLIEEGEDNATLAAVLAHQPAAHTSQMDAGMLDLAGLLPASHGSWRYSGSLTTPPCSEGVSWFVMSETITASAATIGAFTAVHEGNYRPVQPLLERTIAPPHWEYEGEAGPEGWSDLSPDWHACADGEAQSPVDIPAVSPSSAPPMEFDYVDGPQPYGIVNNGHTIQANITANNELMVGDDSWTLLQFHFHAGSEHTVAGVQSPLEMHLVHRDGAGNLAVVGVLIEHGEENDTLAQVLGHQPAVGPANPMAGMLDLHDLLPEGHGSWRYSGSLTTPPCSEGVSWFVMSEPITASAETIELFTTQHEGNFRPTQPLNARHISAPHWTYEGEEGPDGWAELSPDWELCGTGLEQSPIDIPNVVAVEDPAMEFAYAETPLEIVNNGHTVQVNYAAGSSLTVDGATWDLKQFHFHAHSEHAVLGQTWPMEMHLVHANPQGELAVVGVFIEEGAENDALAPVFANLPQMAGPASAIPGARVDAAQMLPAGRSAWRYDGSLTTPPCSEGVKWHVMSEPITASAEQIEAFTELFEENYRPIQELGGRL